METLIYLTHFALLVILIIVTSPIGSYIKLFKDVSFLQAAYVIGRFEFEVLWDLLYELWLDSILGYRS